MLIYCSYPYSVQITGASAHQPQRAERVLNLPNVSRGAPLAGNVSFSSLMSL